jgi:hypothetical protein
MAIIASSIWQLKNNLETDEKHLFLEGIADSGQPVEAFLGVP